MRESEHELRWETIDNLNLIENGLLHIRFELSRDEPSFFEWQERCISFSIEQ